MSSLSPKVAVITASTDGIGYAIAERLAKDGAKVLVSSRNENNVSDAVLKLKHQGLDVSGVVCHVGKEEDRKRLVDTAIRDFGGIDIFVSNAAVNPVKGQILDTTEEQFNKIFDINVKSAFLLTKLIHPIMKSRGNGSIVYMSTAAAYQSLPQIGMYSVSKTSLLGLTRVMANQCAEDNIRVNCVCPGLIKTRFAEFLFNIDNANQLIKAGIPLARLGEPEEIAGIVSFLASDDSSYITGESIVVAGGYHTRI